MGKWHCRQPVQPPMEALPPDNTSQLRDKRKQGTQKRRACISETGGLANAVSMEIWLKDHRDYIDGN